MAIEMTKQDLNFEREKEMDIYYNGEHIGTRRVDFLVEEKIPTELKAISQLDSTNEAQAINYLEAFNLEVGLLINFGEKRLKFKRFVNTPK